MKYSFLILSFISSAYGAGTGGGSPMDLLFPFINFVILMSFIVFKVKKPLSKSFDDMSDEVKKLYSYAEEKDKEAKIKLEMYQEKMKSLPTQEQKIRQESEAEINAYEAALNLETKKSQERITRDAHDRLEGEKKSLINNLNAELLEDMIAKAKGKIKQDQGLQSKVSAKLSSQIEL